MKSDKEIVGVLLGFDDYVNILSAFTSTAVYVILFVLNNSIGQSVSQSVSLSIHPSVNLSVRLLICPSIHQLINQ